MVTSDGKAVLNDWDHAGWLVVKFVAEREPRSCGDGGNGTEVGWELIESRVRLGFSYYELRPYYTFA